MGEDNIKDIELPSDEELKRIGELIHAGHLVVFKYHDRVDVRKDLKFLGKPPCIEDYSEQWDLMATNIIRKLKSEVLESFAKMFGHFDRMAYCELCSRKGIEPKPQSGWHGADKEEFLRFIEMLGQDNGEQTFSSEIKNE